MCDAMHEGRLHETRSPRITRESRCLELIGHCLVGVTFA